MIHNMFDDSNKFFTQRLCLHCKVLQHVMHWLVARRVPNPISSETVSSPFASWSNPFCASRTSRSMSEYMWQSSWQGDPPNLLKDNELSIRQLQLDKRDADGTSQLLAAVVFVMG